MLTRRRAMMASQMEGEEKMKEWKLLYNVVIPEDISADNSGVHWIVNENNEIVGFELLTDENGKLYEAGEVYIEAMSAGAKAVSDIIVYNDKATVCALKGFATTALRYAVAHVKRMGSVYVAQYSEPSASLRFIHDSANLKTTGYYNAITAYTGKINHLKFTVNASSAFGVGSVYKIYVR